MGNKPTSSADKHHTSSRCITADHNFQVTRYSLLRGLGAGNFVSSSAFTVRDHSFYIKMYPDGLREEDKAAHTSLYLCCCSGTPGAKAMFSLTLLEKDAKVGILRSAQITFGTVPGSWGWDKFVDKPKLQDLLSRNDGCLTIRCVLTVIEEPRAAQDESTVMVTTVPESSGFFTECIKATHDFEVTRYSLLQGLSAGKFVSSSTFTLGGYGWNIRMYPDGPKEEDKAAHMSACLYFCGGETRAKVEYSLSLLEKDGKVTNLHSTRHTFEPVPKTWGWEKFIHKSKLQELLSRNDDCFTIRCVLNVIKEPRTEDQSTVVMVPVPESNLHADLATMLKDEEGADVTFRVGDQLFSEHRCVLAARLPVFKAELSGQMKETTMKCIKIDDMEPAIFEALLHFIYTDSLPGNCDVGQNVAAQRLLVAADRYGLDRLKAICEGKLCQKIDVQTVAATLVLADQHHSVHLKSACLRYVSSLDVLRAVKKTDGFKHLVESCPSIMMDILEKLCGV